jgi:hypothetical protein
MTREEFQSRTSFLLGYVHGSLNNLLASSNCFEDANNIRELKEYMDKEISDLYYPTDVPSLKESPQAL